MPKPKITPESILATYEAYTATKAKAKALTDEAKSFTADAAILFERLTQIIKPDTTVAGIHHKVTIKRSPRYTEILAEVRDQLVPKPKIPLIAAIIEAHTTLTETHTITSIDA